jgi:uncharacterized membrane protein
MNKNRLEAFSDGVIAIILTIMVLELKIPHGDKLSDLIPLSSNFMNYLLSFIYLAIYWNNHHHLFQTVKQVNGATLWANVHLLFWLSLIPFVTAWSGDNHFSEVPMAVYGFILLMAGTAYFILTKVLVAQQGKGSMLSKAVGQDFKGIISVVCYAVGIPLSMWQPMLAFLVYVFVAAMWIVPDTRIEKLVSSS